MFSIKANNSLMVPKISFNFYPLVIGLFHVVYFIYYKFKIISNSSYNPLRNLKLI